jgi:hypothetical protein
MLCLKDRKMVELIGLENLSFFLVLSIFIIGYKTERSNNRIIETLDLFEDRINEIEDKIGMKER